MPNLRAVYGALTTIVKAQAGNRFPSAAPSLRGYD